MKRKTLLISIKLVFIVTYILMVHMRYQQIHYDNSKPNIFEIPSTMSQWESAGCIWHEEYYFLQKAPKREDELKSMVLEYINEKNIFTNTNASGEEVVIINFMVPSYSCPIWFEQNKYDMDNFIKHYKETNQVACVYSNMDKVEFETGPAFWTGVAMAELKNYSGWLTLPILEIFVTTCIDAAIAFAIQHLKKVNIVFYAVKINVISRIILYAAFFMMAWYSSVLTVLIGYYMYMEIIALIIKIIICALHMRKQKKHS